MKLVMTLLVRDEVDIVDAQIAFHLNAGVDFVIATDNGSVDGTTEVLERYEREGMVHLIREGRRDMSQAEWVTRMARLAASDFGADWVINADADEFWWPRGGTLKEVLNLVPERYGVVRGCWRHFLPRSDDASSFAERMIVRLGEPAPPGDKRTIFHAHQKVAHRADPKVSVDTGNHEVTGVCLESLRAWHPIEVLHFSWRSLGQAAKKSIRDWEGWSRNVDHGPSLHHVLAHEASRSGRFSEYFDVMTVDDECLERGLAKGTLAIDTRLRDALRTLRAADGRFALPAEGRRLAFPRPDVREDAAYAAEASVLVDVDGVVRSERRVDALEAWLGEKETGAMPSLRNAARRLHRLAHR